MLTTTPPVVGKLYVCEEYFLLLYPDVSSAAEGSAASTISSGAANNSAYWTKQLGKPVSYCEKSDVLLILSVDGIYAEVLAGDKIGWIIVKDWLYLKELNSGA